MKNLGLWILFTFTLCGCTLSLDWFHQIRAKQAASRGDFETAIRILQRIRQHDPDGPRAVTASRLGARVAQVEAKDYSSAVDFYKHLVLKSDDSAERKAAQKNVAQIYFENLQDYNQAVYEYERLLKLELSNDEAFRYRLNLAKCHFHLNNLEQADHEIDTILTRKLEPDEIFDAKLLKANVEVANKNLAGAAQSWEEILKEFPERSKREKVALNLVVVYEEMKDFGKAIETLEHMRGDYPNPEFLDIRISRLKERKTNQPGAQGLKR